MLKIFKIFSFSCTENANLFKYCSYMHFYEKYSIFYNILLHFYAQKNKYNRKDNGILFLCKNSQVDWKYCWYFHFHENMVHMLKILPIFTFSCKSEQIWQMLFVIFTFHWKYYCYLHLENIRYFYAKNVEYVHIYIFMEKKTKYFWYLHFYANVNKIWWK